MDNARIHAYEHKKEVSKTLTIANLISTILVIAIHYQSNKFIDVSRGYNWNYLLQEFLIDGIARVAVPFFATISGFFLINKIGDFIGYLNVLKNRVRTLAIPYFVSLVLIVVVFIFLSSILNISENEETNILFGKITRDYWTYLFSPESTSKLLKFYSIVKSVTVLPIAVQHWFLRDLMILTVISPLILSQKNLYSYYLGLLLGTLWILEIQPFPMVFGLYLINIETLFFFWLGGVLFRFQSFIEFLTKTSSLVNLFSLVVWLSLIAIRIYLDPEFNLWYVKNYTIESLLVYKAAIIVGIISLIQISAILKNNKTLIYLSGFTFFAYLFHLTPLLYFKILTEQIVNQPSSFYLNFPMATVIVFSIAYFSHKYLNKFYMLITGGRTPEKSLQRLQECAD